MPKISKSVAMVRPGNFGFNAQTAGNNAFQNQLPEFSADQIQEIALLEFNNMVYELRNNGIEVIVFDDEDMDTPDSIFPNNWFTTFTDELILYPMFSENRRKERKENIYSALATTINKDLNTELLEIESEGEVVEGTGSLVCDYATQTAFAAMSPRTTSKAMDAFDELSGYSSVRFRSYGPDGELIYHTNVMMTMADTFAVIGLNTIDDNDRDHVRRVLHELGKDLIELSNDQVYHHFAGNMLQLSNEQGEKFLVMSSTAYRSLTPEQIEKITVEHQNTIIPCPLNMIEKIGGGSARCMMAEIFYNA